MSTKYVTVTDATVSKDEPTNGWRLEIWDAQGSALALWPVQDAEELDADAYAEVKILLQNVGIYDQGRASWEKKDDHWGAPVLPRPFAE